MLYLKNIPLQWEPFLNTKQDPYVLNFDLQISLNFNFYKILGEITSYFINKPTNRMKIRILHMKNEAKYHVYIGKKYTKSTLLAQAQQ